MSDEEFKLQPELLSVEPQTEPPCYFVGLTVENVRSFGAAQSLDLSDGQGRPAQWVILLGDNGSGKTTLLQSLAAMVPRPLQLNRNSPDAPHGTHFVSDIFLNSGITEKYRNFLRVGAGRFKISAQLATGLRIQARNAQFRPHSVSVDIDTLGGSSAESFPSGLELFSVYGYGATRRIGTASLSETGDSDPCATLFDENCALLNAEEWLLQADYAAAKSNDQIAAQRRDRIKNILIRLLPDVTDLRIETSAGKTAFVEALTPFGWVKVRSLSSGYRSVVAWMVDLASRLFERYPNSQDPLAEPAVVLVDQIDLLLHPKWKRELVQTLTTIFQNTQFIVTAHSPLIVQAATEAKIVLLRREGDHVVIDNRPDSVRGWRLDQIISSDLFENLGTRDPKTEEFLKQRKDILTKPALSEDDKNALHKIDEAIGVLRFGENAEQNRAMEIIERAAKKLQGQTL